MPFLPLTYEQAEHIYKFIDWIHPFFLYLDVIAVLALLESFLPTKTKFESDLDRVLTYCKFAILFFFMLIALSQGFLGGCFIHIPQNWFSDTYLNGKYHNPFGLFGRQAIAEKYWPWLRLFYLVGSLLIGWRVWEYWQKRVRLSLYESNRHNPKSLS